MTDGFTDEDLSAIESNPILNYRLNRSVYLLNSDNLTDDQRASEITRLADLRKESNEYLQNEKNNYLGAHIAALRSNSLFNEQQFNLTIQERIFPILISPAPLIKKRAALTVLLTFNGSLNIPELHYSRKETIIEISQKKILDSKLLDDTSEKGRMNLMNVYLETYYQLSGFPFGYIKKDKDKDKLFTQIDEAPARSQIMSSFGDDFDTYMGVARKYFSGNLFDAYRRIGSLVKKGTISKDSSIWKALSTIGTISTNVENVLLILKDTTILNEPGIEGYMKFADKYFNGGMSNAYRTMSSLVKAGKIREDNPLVSSMQVLGNIPISTNTITEILKDTEVFKLKGIWGYRTLADRYFNGSMSSAYRITSSLVKAEKVKDDNLLVDSIKTIGNIVPTTSIITEILNDKEIFDLNGIDGYIAFAEKYFNGNMLDAHQTISALYRAGSVNKNSNLWLSMKKIGGMKMNVSNLEKLYQDQDIININDLTGYIDLSRKHFGGNLFNTYVTIASLVRSDKIPSDSTLWKTLRKNGSLFGTVETLELMTNDSEILDSTGVIGYMNFAQKYFRGNMQIAYRQLAVLAKTNSTISESSLWKSINRIGQLRTNIKVVKALTGDYDIHLEKGLEGYMKFADKYFNGSMQSAFTTLTSLVNSGLILDSAPLWKTVNSIGAINLDTTTVGTILNDSSIVNLERLNGYIKIANKYFNGNLLNTYKAVSSLVKAGKVPADSLLWQSLERIGMIPTNVETVYAVSNDTDLLSLSGLDGYAYLATKHFKGNYRMAYSTISALVKAGKISENSTLWNTIKEIGSITADVDTVDTVIAEINLSARGSVEEYDNLTKKYFRNIYFNSYTSIAALVRAKKISDEHTLWLTIKNLGAGYKKPKKRKRY
jgi:hypothetical protein